MFGWYNSGCNHKTGRKKFPLDETELCGFYIYGDEAEIV